jgi:hypothetical protein
MMKDLIRELMHVTPFVPFVIHMANGSAIRVPRTDFIAAGSDSPFVFVEDEKAYVHRINVMLIRSLEEDPSAQAA